MAAGCLFVRLRYGLCSTWGTCDSVEPPPPRSPHWEGSGMEGSGCLSKHSSPANRGPHTMLAPKHLWPFEGILTSRWVLPSALAVCQLHSIRVCVSVFVCVGVCMCMYRVRANSPPSMLGNALIPGPPSSPACPSVWPRAPRPPAAEGRPLPGYLTGASYGAHLT